jgi:hypothetical protein
MFTIRLTQTLSGWVLIPVSEDSKTVLSELYAQDYDTLKPSERAFESESVTTAIAHVRDVCRDLKIGMSVCGKKTSPTIRLWWSPVVPTPVTNLSVDLKWSCWTEDRSIWDDYAPGVWEKMEAAFRGLTDPVRIDTGPRKEIRYGSILIEKGSAQGYFCTEWDDIDSLAETLGTTDPSFIETIPMSSHNLEPGIDWDFKIKARKFSCLMRKIDTEENNLLVTDQREWDFIKNCFKPENQP